MTKEFDVREVRHRLKQFADDGDTKLFENRGSVECPACGTPFERLFVTRRTSTSFAGNDGSRFCLIRGSTYSHVFRH